MSETDNLAALMDRWTASLVQVLESMTDQRPEVSWARQSAPGTPAELLWWEQPFQVGTAAALWIGAPRVTWEQAGTLTLKAAGLETVELNEARNTWIEILGQSLSAVVRYLGSLVGREVTSDGGAEKTEGPPGDSWVSVSLTYPANSQPSQVWAAFTPALLALLAAPQSVSAGPDAAEAANLEPQNPASPSATMDLLLDVDLPISISFGRARLPMKDVLKLTTGSIVELDRGVNDPVEVLVNHCLIARGEVVVVEGNYGIRIQEIASRQTRLRSVR